MGFTTSLFILSLILFLKLMFVSVLFSIKITSFGEERVAMVDMPVVFLLFILYALHSVCVLFLLVSWVGYGF